jgi:polyisoprenoid-binding protein YceI
MAVTQQSPSSTWKLDKIHSNAGFEVRHAGVSIFSGSFGDIDAELSFVAGEPRLSGSAIVKSVQVPDETLTSHLLAPDFFDAERHPEIQFSSSAARLEGDSIVVEGDLTIKGHTEHVTAHGRISHVDADLAGGQRYGVELETSIDRTQFGVDWNAPLPGGGVAVDNDVKLVVRLELTPGV